VEPDDRRVLSARRGCSGRARSARTGLCDETAAGPGQKEKARAGAQVASFFLSQPRRPWGPVRRGLPSLFVCGEGIGFEGRVNRNLSLETPLHARGKLPQELRNACSRKTRSEQGFERCRRGRVPCCRRASFCALKGNADRKDPCEVLPRSSESFRKPVRRVSEVPLRWEGCHEGFRRNRPRRRCRDASPSGKKEEYERGGDGMRHAGSSDLPAQRIVISTRRTRVACSPRARPSRARDFHTVSSSFPPLVATSASWKCIPLVHSVRARAWERSRQALEQRSTRAVLARDLDHPRDPIALHDPATGLRCVIPPTRRKGFGT